MCYLHKSCCCCCWWVLINLCCDGFKVQLSYKWMTLWHASNTYTEMSKSFKLIILTTPINSFCRRLLHTCAVYILFLETFKTTAANSWELFCSCYCCCHSRWLYQVHFVDTDRKTRWINYKKKFSSPFLFDMWIRPYMY